MTVQSLTHSPKQTYPTIARPAWQRAFELFDAGDYFDCHEALEIYWREATGQTRELLAGLILLAASLHKHRRQRHLSAARRLHRRALAHLASLPDPCFDIQLRELERRCAHALADPAHRVTISWLVE